MTKLTKAQLDANIQIMTQLNDTGLPDGAVLEHDSRRSVGWRICACQDRLIDPYGSIYRIVLPKPAPHPTLLSIVEHGCSAQDWAEWFAVDQCGAIYVYASKPELSGCHAHWRSNDDTHLLFNLNATQHNWEQQCWTLQELRDIIKQNAASQKETLCNGVTLEEVSSVLIHAANVCFDNDFAYDMQPFGEKLVTIRDRLNGDVGEEEGDIIKQNNENTASQGSITRNTVALSEAELYCHNVFLRAEDGKIHADFLTIHDIGRRIAAQRKAAQS